MVTIALAADAGFSKQLAAVLATLPSEGTELRAFVLHTGFDDAARQRVGQTAAVAPTWVDIDAAALDGVRVPPYLGRASVLRLLLPAVLPADVGRVLYLDADVLVRAPLDALWETDLGGAAAGAVRDAVVPWAGSPNALPWRTLGVAPTAPYFNTGVLLADLDAWRELDVAERALRALRDHQLAHGDQCALNLTLEGRVHQLDPRWNVQAGHLQPDASSAYLVEEAPALDAAVASPAIVHFNTSPLGRPWSSGCTHPFAPEWLAALDRTSWSGWRPSLARELREQFTEPGLGTRLGRRLQVAGHALLRGE